jgi:TonB family protein
MGLWADSIEGARQAMYRGDYANAEQMLNIAIDAAQHSKSPSALDQPLDLLAQVYQRQKRFQESAAVQLRRVDLWTGMYGPNAVVVGRVLGQVAAMEREAHDLSGAEAHARTALTIMTAGFADKPPAAQAAMDLADILIAEDRNEEAEQMFAMAQKMFESSLGPQSMQTSGAAARRATLLRQLGHAAEANQLAQIQSAPVYRVGGGVTMPRILSKVEPQYSEEARKKKLQGSISLSLVVDPTGMPTQIAVLRPLGMGLDQNAIEAISQWRFVPGTKDGTPVPIFTQIEVTLHLM